MRGGLCSSQRGGYVRPHRVQMNQREGERSCETGRSGASGAGPGGRRGEEGERGGGRKERTEVRRDETMNGFGSSQETLVVESGRSW